MTENVELQSCPFCGSDGKWTELFLDDCEIYQASCSNDDCKIFNLFISGHNREVVIEGWNTRTPSPPSNGQRALEAIHPRYADRSGYITINADDVANIRAAIQSSPEPTVDFPRLKQLTARLIDNLEDPYKTSLKSADPCVHDGLKIARTIYALLSGETRKDGGM